MRTEFLIYWAGFVLIMILIANLIAPKMLNYGDNIGKMETFHGQVFTIHSAYIGLTLAGMALLCVLYNAELAAVPNEVGKVSLARGICFFMALFWGTRVFVQLFYYDKQIKQKYPVFNVMFLTAFAYLAILFTFLSLK